jgi:hypothetical protein
VSRDHRTHRALILLALGAVGACAAAPARPVLAAGSVWKQDARCSIAADADAQCRAKGCQTRRPLTCSGIDLPPPTEEELEAIEESYRTGRAGCACVCAEDVEACSQVP